jgi:hypothetical protein
MADYLGLVWLGLGFMAGLLAIVYGGRGLSREPGKPAKPTALGWCVLAFGLVSLVLALMVTGGGSDRVTWTLAAGIATLIAGIGAVVRRDRHWPTWAGLVIGGIPALFWALFALGYLLGWAE